MLYFYLKYIHIISSTILFGTGLGTACTAIYGYKTKDVHLIAGINRYVALGDILFTTSSAVTQVVTGFWMVYLAGYSFKNFWIYGAIVGYIIAMLCWIPVVYLQNKMRNIAIFADKNHQNLPAIYDKYYRLWFCLGWPAFISLLFVFYLMTFKP